jgi:hypothetical protein
MAATTTLPVLFATGLHAARPAASAIGAGGLYSCTTHSLVYQTDGVSTWSTWATLGGAAVTDATITTTDVTTNNVSTSKHGWAPKGDANAAHYLDGTGAYSTPAGSGGGFSLITSTTLGSAAASMSISSISASYKDLMVVASLRCTNATATVDAWLRVGNTTVDSGTNYADETIFDGSGSGSVNGSAQSRIYLGPTSGGSATAGIFSAARFEIFDYLSTTNYRHVMGHAVHASGTDHYATRIMGSWKNAASALDIITILPDSGNLATGSRMYLYGRV